MVGALRLHPAFAGKAWAEEQPAEAAALEQLKASLDEIEATIAREDVTAETLAGLAARSTPPSSDPQKIDELEPRVRELDERLKQLGPAPAKDAPAESEDIAKEREELTSNFSELDGELKQYRLLSVRAEQLSDRLAEKRHALYAGELFARSPSILDPFFWRDAFRALPIEMRSATALFETWTGERPDPGPWIAAALILLAIAAITIALSRWWFPRCSPGRTTPAAEGRTAFWVFVWFAARTPLAGLAGCWRWSCWACWPGGSSRSPRGSSSPWRRRRLAAARRGAVCARPSGTPIGAGRRRHRPLLSQSSGLGDARARGDDLLQVVHKVLFAPLIVTVATNALFGAVAAAFLSDFIFRLGRIRSGERNALAAAPWIHPLALLLTVLIVLALVAGYPAWRRSWRCG